METARGTKDLAEVFDKAKAAILNWYGKEDVSPDALKSAAISTAHLGIYARLAQTETNRKGIEFMITRTLYTDPDERQKYIALTQPDLVAAGQPTGSREQKTKKRDAK